MEMELDKFRDRDMVGSGQDLTEKFIAMGIRASQVVIKEQSGGLGWLRPQKALYCSKGPFSCTYSPSLFSPLREK